MFSIDEKVLNVILDKKFRSFIGVFCERTENRKLDKKLTKEIIFDVKKGAWEAMRNIESEINSFSKGVNINVKFQQPSS